MEVTDEKPIALVLDDDPDFLVFFGRLLAHFGFEMKACAREAEFIAKLKGSLPSICFVDLNINGVESGFALVRSVRGKFGPKLPVFIVSGKSEPRAVAHAIECGATDFIPKPVDKEVLASKLARYSFAADEVKEDGLNYLTAPDGGFPAELATSLRLAGVDEISLTIHSSHLIPKGTVFWIDGEFARQLAGGERPLQVSVISNEVLPAGEGFKLTAEFEAPSDELLASVRRWIQGTKQD